MYYALRKSSMDNLISRFCHFNKLMEIIESKRENLVHFDGVSMPVEDFFHSEYRGIYRGQNPDFRLCQTVGDEPTNECEYEVREILRAYENNERSATETSSSLNCIKLGNLNVVQANRRLFEGTLASEHWEVLVALINAYIVVHVQGARPDTHYLIGNDIFGLKDRSDLEEIFKEALKRPRDRMYFVSTAAEHILSIMEPEKIDGVIKHIDVAPLDVNIRERLKRLALEFKRRGMLTVQLRCSQNRI